VSALAVFEKAQGTAVEVVTWGEQLFETGDVIEYTHFEWDVLNSTKLWTRHIGRIESMTLHACADMGLVHAEVWTSGGRPEGVWFHRAGQITDLRHVTNHGKLGPRPEGSLF